MKKYAIKLTKNNQEKILATYANAEDAFLYGGKVSNELPKNAGTVSCIYADFDDEDNRIDKKYELYKTWI